MNTNILDHPMLVFRKPWWLPFLSIFITLFGILALDWNLVPIVFLFWWEVILMVGAALIRMLFALDSRPFWDKLLTKIFILAGGVVLGGAMVILTVSFSYGAMVDIAKFGGFGQLAAQIWMLAGGYVLGLVLHYFVNGRYKTASPWGELMQTSTHLLALLALLMVLTMHLIPNFPQLKQAKWVAVAMVVVKFLVEWLVMNISKSVRGDFATWNSEQ